MRNKKPIRIAFTLMIILGVVARAMPMMNVDDRLFKQWVTEDGYLMLTMARNIGIGNGMSIADGQIATNGTQPLVTFIFAGAYWLFQGNKTLGIYFAHVFELIISLATCIELFYFSRDLLADDRKKDATDSTARMRDYLGEYVPFVAAGYWFISPVYIGHTMNHLETGTYCLMILVSVWAWFARLAVDQSANDLRSSLVIGILLGITALVRIDAVFLIASITVWNVLFSFWSNDGTNWQQRLPRRILQSMIMGSVAVLITSPWLLNNKLRFGSFTPISGLSQKLEAGFAENLIGLSPTLVEFAVLVLPIPKSWEGKSTVQAVCSVIFLAWLVSQLALSRHADLRQRFVMAIAATFVSAFVIYYGCFFGAPYFLSRYLSPGSIFFCISSSILLLWLLEKTRTPKAMRVCKLVGTFVFCGILLGRLYQNGSQHMHWHVVKWTEENVSEETWIGAIQTGTLGYFHDRTINLDGKVNPFAYEARTQDGIPAYIADSEIEYLIDWQSILEWHRDTSLNQTFHVLVDQSEGYRGLGVMRRNAK